LQVGKAGLPPLFLHQLKMIKSFLFVAVSTLMVAGCTADETVSKSKPNISNTASEIPHSASEISIATSDSDGPININTATSEELQRLPHIGASMARKIIEHREKHGLFKRPEQLMMISGISDVRFRRIRHLIRVK
jgi:competence ComEA-like helix-hairpin-helix protein